jgi:hypothetical protein
MAERDVTEEEIVAVLEAPEADWPSKEAQDRRVYRSHPGKREVTVVVVEGTDPVRVVTVWANPR